MKTILRMLVILIPLVSCSTSLAATTQTIGAGSAVVSAERVATFDSLNSSGIDLSAYSEDNLDITVDDTTFVGFDAFGDGTTSQFHYGTSGNSSYVTIKASDASPIRALEAKVGHGWAVVIDLNIYWETWLGGVLVSSGQYWEMWGT